MSDIEWNGEGLPPVGQVCERCVSRGLWVETQIYAHHPNGRYAAFADVYGMNWASAGTFRTKPTPEQISAEAERKNAVAELFRIMTGHSNMKAWKDTCYEDHAQAIYDAGWRKTEAPK